MLFCYLILLPYFVICLLLSCISDFIYLILLFTLFIFCYLSYSYFGYIIFVVLFLLSYFLSYFDLILLPCLTLSSNNAWQQRLWRNIRLCGTSDCIERIFSTRIISTLFFLDFFFTEIIMNIFTTTRYKRTVITRNLLQLDWIMCSNVRI